MKSGTRPKSLPLFDLPGVYILSEFSGEDDDLPTIYIGEGDGIRGRIDSHFKTKDFWAWGIAFVSTNNGLNKSHVQWLEYALVKQATAARRCHLENGNVPQEPTLEDSEKAGTRIFLKEILRILPLAGLRALEIPKAIASPQTKSFASNALTQPSGELSARTPNRCFLKPPLIDWTWSAPEKELSIALIK